ncbi:MAG: poly(3-hydroxyalkanoate) depolymerase, partial [Mycobacterium sp.]
LTPRRFADADYAAYVLGQLYGGVARVSGNEAVRQYLRMQTGSRVGYLYQLLAGSVWTSLFVLPAVRQETLIVAGTDDPIIPVVNARIMNALMPHSQLYLHAGGHIDLLFNAAPLAPVIESFRRESTYGGG